MMTRERSGPPPTATREHPRGAVAAGAVTERGEASGTVPAKGGIRRRAERATPSKNKFQKAENHPTERQGDLLGKQNSCSRIF